MSMAPVQAKTEDYPPLLHLETVSQYIALPPSTLANPHKCLCAAHLSPLLLSYYPPARGIVLAYLDVHLSDSPSPPPQISTSKSNSRPKSVPKKVTRRQPESEDSSAESGAESGEEEEGESEEESRPLLMKVMDEYSAVFTWATTTFLVFRPQKNVWVEGRVSSQSSSHIQVSHLNVFGVSILRKNLPADWEWVPDTTGSEATYKKKGDGKAEGGGHYINGDGEVVDGVLRFRLRDWDMRARSGNSKGHIRIEGSLLTEEEEEKAENGKLSHKDRLGKKHKVMKRKEKQHKEPVIEEGEPMEVS